VLTTRPQTLRERSALTTQLLFVAATLGLAEALADGPLPPAALADAVGADPARLVRVLRGLAAEGVLAEGRALRRVVSTTGTTGLGVLEATRA